MTRYQFSEWSIEFLELSPRVGAVETQRHQEIFQANQPGLLGPIILIPKTTPVITQNSPILEL